MPDSATPEASPKQGESGRPRAGWREFLKEHKVLSSVPVMAIIGMIIAHYNAIATKFDGALDNIAKPDPASQQAGVNALTILQMKGQLSAERQLLASTKLAQMLRPPMERPVPMAVCDSADTPTHIKDAVHLLAQIRPVQLDTISLEGAHLNFVSFEGLDVHGWLFRRACLVRSRFAHANLDGAAFDGADMSFADLTGASVANTSFSGVRGKTQMSHALLDSIHGDSAIFHKASLGYAHFSHASLPFAVFNGADLTCALFHDAVHDSADFADAVLDRTDFRGDNLATSRNLPRVAVATGMLTSPGSVNTTLQGVTKGQLKTLRTPRKTSPHC